MIHSTYRQKTTHNNVKPRFNTIFVCGGSDKLDKAIQGYRVRQPPRRVKRRAGGHDSPVITWPSRRLDIRGPLSVHVTGRTVSKYSAHRSRTPEVTPEWPLTSPPQAQSGQVTRGDGTEWRIECVPRLAPTLMIWKWIIFLSFNFKINDKCWSGACVTLVALVIQVE